MLFRGTFRLSSKICERCYPHTYLHLDVSSLSSSVLYQQPPGSSLQLAGSSLQHLLAGTQWKHTPPWAPLLVWEGLDRGGGQPAFLV